MQIGSDFPEFEQVNYTKTFELEMLSGKIKENYMEVNNNGNNAYTKEG